MNIDERIEQQEFWCDDKNVYVIPASQVRQILTEVLEYVKPKRQEQIPPHLPPTSAGWDSYFRHGGFNQAIKQMDDKAQELGLLAD